MSRRACERCGAAHKHPVIAVVALRSTSEPRCACAPKSASREIFRKSRASRGRSAAYAFVALKDFAYAYEKPRQDRQSLQTDPVGYEADNNLYAYTNNDPLNLRDPNGERPEGLAEARNPYMRDSQRSNVPVDRGGVGPRNTTVQAGASMSFVAGAGGSGGGGRYSYYDARGVETERGSYYTLPARAGVDIGANVGVTATEGAPTDSTSQSGGVGVGLRAGWSAGGGGTRFIPDQNFQPRQPPSFTQELSGDRAATCVATAGVDGSTTTQCSGQ